MSGAIVLLQRVLHTVATAERTCSALARVRVDRPADQATVERFVALFVEDWPRATDSFHPNAHGCLSRIAFVDAVVVALAESVNPLPRPPSLDALR